MIQKSYLGGLENLWVRFPELRRREHPLLTDALGIVFEIFETEVNGKFLLIVDYRYATERPDGVRFLQEPWLEVPAFSLNKEESQQSVEVIQCDTHSERQQAFWHLIHLLKLYPGGKIGFGDGPIDFGTGENDGPAPVPRKPVPPTRSAGCAQQPPEEDNSTE